jgi:hypothetical protein
MTSILRRFNTGAVDSYYVVTDVGLGTSHLFGYDIDHEFVDISTGSVVGGTITAVNLVTGSILMDLGYEVYKGTAQYRKVALV